MIGFASDLQIFWLKAKWISALSLAAGRASVSAGSVRTFIAGMLGCHCGFGLIHWESFYVFDCFMLWTSGKILLYYSISQDRETIVLQPTNESSHFSLSAFLLYLCTLCLILENPPVVENLAKEQPWMPAMGIFYILVFLYITGG